MNTLCCQINLRGLCHYIIFSFVTKQCFAIIDQQYQVNTMFFSLPQHLVAPPCSYMVVQLRQNILFSEKIIPKIYYMAQTTLKYIPFRAVGWRIRAGTDRIRIVPSRRNQDRIRASRKNKYDSYVINVQEVLTHFVYYLTILYFLDIQE